MRPINDGKPRIHLDPRNLSVEELEKLRALYIARLKSVNSDLMERYRTLGDLGKGLPNCSEGRSLFYASADRLENFAKELDQELNKTIDDDLKG